MCRRNYYWHTACEHIKQDYANPFTMCGKDPGSRFRLPCPVAVEVVLDCSGHCRDCMETLEKKLEVWRIRQQAGWEWVCRLSLRVGDWRGGVELGICSRNSYKTVPQPGERIRLHESFSHIDRYVIALTNFMYFVLSH